MATDTPEVFRLLQHIQNVAEQVVAVMPNGDDTGQRWDVVDVFSSQPDQSPIATGRTPLDAVKAAMAELKVGYPNEE